MPLHGGDEDLAAALAGLLADALVRGPDPLGDLGVELRLHLGEQLGSSLLLGQTGHPLELAADQAALALCGLAQLLELLLAPGQALLALLELADAPLQSLLTLAGALLEASDLGAALADVGLGLAADPEGLLARADEDLLRLLLDGLLAACAARCRRRRAPRARVCRRRGARRGGRQRRRPRRCPSPQLGRRSRL